jgi:NAD(P)-dependent dehydrogenase (short-subunit alcohol dehydrogenase family)
VTGGSSGIGLATAEQFAQAGYAVVIVGRDAAKLAIAAQQIDGGPPVHTISADAGTIAGIEKIVAETRDRFGHLDALFANAGRSDTPDLLDVTETDFDNIMATNVKSVFFLVTKALPVLTEGAAVVVTSSVVESKGRHGDPLYAASKAAVRSFVRTLALDGTMLARQIRVNAVTPGFIRTPMTQLDDPATQRAIDEYMSGIVPAQRWGTPDDVARAVLFLADRNNSYITGSEILVDGGLAQT